MRSRCWTFAFALAIPFTLSLTFGVDASQLERYRASMMPSEEESLELAETLQETLHAGDLLAVNRLLDTGALVERVVADVPASTPHLESFIDGLIPSLQERAWFGVEVVAALETGGHYRFLRTFERNGERRVLYRLLTRDGGLNYHEMILERRGLVGPVRVADVYVHLTGEKLSESYRQVLLDAASGVVGVRRFNELVRQRRFREAVDAYARLPESVRDDKSMLIKRLMMTQGLSDELYVATIERLQSLYPDDATLDLVMLDACVLRGSYSTALEILDRLDARVGGDPYLDVQRAGVFMLRDEHAIAARLATQAISEDPMLEAGYWTLASIALETKDWALLVRALGGLEDNLALEFRDLEDMPEYAEFLGSVEYEQWGSTHPD